jgi:phosphoribosylformimino-5-aminoimidazole carboxamide ribotide isomerase
MSEFARLRPWVTGIVIGLESIDQADFVPATLAEIGPRHAIFSLDLMGGRPVTRISAWSRWTPIQVVAQAVAAGFTRLIVLDLKAVGTGQGPATYHLCRELRALHPQLEIISGGGARSARDIHSWLEAGCDRVLVASALHDGRLSELRQVASNQEHT